MTREKENVESFLHEKLKNGLTFVQLTFHIAKNTHNWYVTYAFNNSKSFGESSFNGFCLIQFGIRFTVDNNGIDHSKYFSSFVSDGNVKFSKTQ